MQYNKYGCKVGPFLEVSDFYPGQRFREPQRQWHWRNPWGIWSIPSVRQHRLWWPYTCLSLQSTQRMLSNPRKDLSQWVASRVIMDIFNWWRHEEVKQEQDYWIKLLLLGCIDNNSISVWVFIHSAKMNAPGENCMLSCGWRRFLQGKYGWEFLFAISIAR